VIESFHWDNNYILGIESVDKQHKHLVDLTNQLAEIVSENQNDLKAIRKLIDKLSDYTIYHFHDEETVMVKYGVDHRHIVYHKRKHSDFVNEIIEISSTITQENTQSLKYLLDFLTHWLIYHILGDDKSMARQIGWIKAGYSPKEAFEKEQKRKSDSSMELLLRALNNLFAQVSHKNSELVKLNKTLEEKVQERTKELLKVTEELKRLSLTDNLTKLPNRRHAIQTLEKCFQEARLHNKPLVCMMVDADHFKEINDTFGHDAGDLVLVKLSQNLTHSVRNDDLVCRLGGDEFLIICPNTDLAGGMILGETIRKNVSELYVPITNNNGWHGSVSIGVAELTKTMKSYKDLIKIADDSVYVSKRKGKNRVSTVL